MWNLKNNNNNNGVQTNLSTKQKKSSRCRKQTYGYQRGRQEGKLGDWN